MGSSPFAINSSQGQQIMTPAEKKEVLGKVFPYAFSIGIIIGAVAALSVFDSVQTPLSLKDGLLITGIMLGTAAVTAGVACGIAYKYLQRNHG